MSVTEKDKRITLNATELEKKIIERYGLQACGIIETIRDCEVEDKEKTEQNGTHDSRTENTTGTTA